MDVGQLEQLQKKIEEMVDAKTRNLQSSKDRKDSENQELRQKLDQIQKQIEDQRVQQEQVKQQYQYKSLEDQHKRELEEEGDTPFVRAKHNAEKQLYQANQWYVQNAARIENAIKHEQAYQLSEKTGVSMKDLLRARTPEEMQQIAESSAKTVELSKKIEELQKLIDERTNAQEFDQSPSSTGSGGDDHWYETTWPTILNPTKEQRERAKRIHEKYMLST